METELLSTEPVADLVCPECRNALVSNFYYIGGRGYLLVWECVNILVSSLIDLPICSYRRVV